jgi:hypothetical protein
MVKIVMEKSERLGNILMGHYDRVICIVLGRILGIDLSPDEAIERTRQINPEKLGKLEAALYDIGREYCCPPNDPDVSDCNNCLVGAEAACDTFNRGRINNEERPWNIPLEVPIMLSDFIHVVQYSEQNCRVYAEEMFWEAHAELGGNFLAQPLDISTLKEPVHKFISAFRAYRKPIDWAELARAWTHEAQIVASSLTGVCLEDADDSILRKADWLYSHLASAKVVGLGPSIISKLLALSLPDLCVMWDDKIRKDFLASLPHAPGFSKRPQSQGDYYRFLADRHQTANDLVKQVIQGRNLNREQAIDWLCNLPVVFGTYKQEKPLAKLLDEYYRSRDEFHRSYPIA